jgi:hypothetical protein
MIINLTMSKESVLKSIRDDVNSSLIYPDVKMRAATMLSNLTFTVSDVTGIPQSEISDIVKQIFNE